MLYFCSWRLVNHGLSSDYHPGVSPQPCLPICLLTGPYMTNHSYLLVRLWSVPEVWAESSRAVSAEGVVI